MVFKRCHGIIGEAGDGGERVGEFGFGENDGGRPPGGEAETGAHLNEMGKGFSSGVDLLIKVTRG